MSYGKKLFLYIFSDQLFLEKLVLLMIKIWFIEVNLLIRNLIYSPTFATFDKITWSKRVPNFSLTVSTYEDTELRSTGLNTFTVETDKRMGVRRYGLWRYTSLASHFPKNENLLYISGCFAFCPVFATPLIASLCKNVSPLIWICLG